MATKNTDERFICPACKSAELSESAGHSAGQKALWLLQRAKETLPDHDAEGIALVEEAIEYLECGE